MLWIYPVSEPGEDYLITRLVGRSLNTQITKKKKCKQPPIKFYNEMHSTTMRDHHRDDDKTSTF